MFPIGPVSGHISRQLHIGSRAIGGQMSLDDPGPFVQSMGLLRSVSQGSST